MYIKGLQNLMTAVQMGGPDLKMEVKNIHWAKLFANKNVFPMLSQWADKCLGQHAMAYLDWWT